MFNVLHRRNFRPQGKLNFQSAKPSFKSGRKPTGHGQTEMANRQDRLEWIERIDALLERAEVLTSAARAQDAPLAERIGLWVEIIAVRKQLDGERTALDSTVTG